MGQLIEFAQEGFPHEVVGILAGNRDRNTVTKITTLHNERGDTNNRYKVSALTLMKAETALEDDGLEIVGYYHSHPNHSAHYSEYDRDHALPNMSYLILSIQNGVFTEALSWRLLENRSEMESEHITYI